MKKILSLFLFSLILVFALAANVSLAGTCKCMDSSAGGQYDTPCDSCVEGQTCPSGWSCSVSSGSSNSSGGTAGGGSATLNNPLGVSFEGIIKNVITAALGLTGVLALISFIYGGLLWMISGGDASKVKKGKDVMIWAVFGIFVIFSSYAVLTFIFSALGIVK